MGKLLRQLMSDQIELATTTPEIAGAGGGRPHPARAGRGEPRRQRPRRHAGRRSSGGQGVAAPRWWCRGGVCVSDNGGGMDAETARTSRAVLSTRGPVARVRARRRCTVSSVRAAAGSSSTRHRAPDRRSRLTLPLSEAAQTPAPPKPAAADGGAETGPPRRGRCERPRDRDQDAREPRLPSPRSRWRRGGYRSRRRLALEDRPPSLMDLSMPGLSGRETAAAVRDLAPAAKVLYCPGTPTISSSAKARPSRAARSSRSRSVSDLARRVREVLDPVPTSEQPGHSRIVRTRIAIARTTQTTDHATTQNQPSDIFIA